MIDRVEFKTKDGINIVGDFYKAENASSVAVLLHMMPADRKSWKIFAEKLQKAGISSLAIDLRGHGESDGGPDGFLGFSDADHQASIRDVEATADWLRSRGYTNLHLAGASIGANLALEFLSESENTKSAILLSSGLNYRGVLTEPFAKKLSEEKSVFFVGDEEDMRSSGASAAEMARKLYELTSAKKQIRIFKEGLHGTDMLKKHSEFEDELVSWIKGKI